MVGNAEVVIALGMPDTVHYWSHVEGDRTSNCQELMGGEGLFFAAFRLEIFRPSRCTSDYDDKNVEASE